MTAYRTNTFHKSFFITGSILCNRFSPPMSKPQRGIVECTAFRTSGSSNALFVAAWLFYNRPAYPRMEPRKVINVSFLGCVAFGAGVLFETVFFAIWLFYSNPFTPRVCTGCHNGINLIKITRGTRAFLCAVFGAGGFFGNCPLSPRMLVNLGRLRRRLLRRRLLRSCFAGSCCRRCRYLRSCFIGNCFVGGS